MRRFRRSIVLALALIPVAVSVAVASCGSNEGASPTLEDASARDGNVVSAEPDAGSGVVADGAADGSRRSEPNIRVFAGGDVSCALIGGVSLKCWGAIGFNYVIDASTSAFPIKALATGNAASDLSLESAHACVNTAPSGAAPAWSCWGSNATFQLGRSSLSSPCTGAVCPPPGIEAPAPFVDLRVGFQRTCGVDATGKVSCWGWSDFGLLGSASDAGSNTPVPSLIAGLDGVKLLVMQDQSNCALRADGTVWCWGANDRGALGRSTSATAHGTDNSAHAAPAAVTGLTGVVSVSEGSDHVCAVLQGGTVSCWGWNGFTNQPAGCLGHSPTLDPVCVDTISYCSVTPQWVPGISGAREVVVGAWHTCALLSDDTVSCWGRNVNGVLGHDSAEDKDDAGQPLSVVPPRKVEGLSNVAHLASGGLHTCAVTWADEVYCWGDNQSKQLGADLDGGQSFVPRRVTGF